MPFANTCVRSNFDNFSQIWKKVDQTYLIWFIEEIFNSSRNTPDKSKWVSDDIKTQYKYIELLDALVCVVFGNLHHQLRLGVEITFPFKISKPGWREAKVIWLM